MGLDLKVKIYADGADLETIKKLASQPEISGFTTNPTLMRKSGVTDYEKFSRSVIEEVKDLPLSFEVFADNLDDMYTQALQISSWGPNVFVKIPVVNSLGEFTGPIINSLSSKGVKLNVTALMTALQVDAVIDLLDDKTETVISVFAGRIADTGCDPVSVMIECLKILQKKPMSKLLWASPREVYNIYQANDIGCHIITVPPEMLEKLKLAGKNLDEFSRETSEMFYNDALSAGYKL